MAAANTRVSISSHKHTTSTSVSQFIRDFTTPSADPTVVADLKQAVTECVTELSVTNKNVMCAKDICAMFIEKGHWDDLYDVVCIAFSIWVCIWFLCSFFICV